MSSDIQLERLIAERTADKATIAALTAEVARLEHDATKRHPHAYYATGADPIDDRDHPTATTTNQPHGW